MGVKLSGKDAAYVVSLLIGAAMAYGTLVSKVQAQAEAVKAIPLLAEQVGRLSGEVSGLKDAIGELRREIRRR